MCFYQGTLYPSKSQEVEGCVQLGLEFPAYAIQLQDSLWSSLVVQNLIKMINLIILLRFSTGFTLDNFLNISTGFSAMNVVITFFLLRIEQLSDVSRTNQITK